MIVTDIRYIVSAKRFGKGQKIKPVGRTDKLISKTWTAAMVKVALREEKRRSGEAQRISTEQKLFHLYKLAPLPQGGYTVVGVDSPDQYVPRAVEKIRAKAQPLMQMSKEHEDWVGEKEASGLDHYAASILSEFDRGGKFSFKDFGSLNHFQKRREQPVSVLSETTVLRSETKFIENYQSAYDYVVKLVQNLEHYGQPVVDQINDRIAYCSAALETGLDSYNEHAAALIRNSSLETNDQVARAYKTMSILWNAAERAQIRVKLEEKEREKASDPIYETIQWLRDEKGKTYDEAADLIYGLCFVNTTTSHPNKGLSYTETGLQTDVEECFYNLYDNADKASQEALHRRIKRIASNLLTDREPHERPTIQKDIERLARKISDNGYRATRQTAVQLHQAFRLLYPEYDSADRRLYFPWEEATWTGIDGDGNPNAGAEPTRYAFKINRTTALSEATKALQELEKIFGISDRELHLQPGADEPPIYASLRTDATLLQRELTEDDLGTPYLTKLRFMQEKLKHEAALIGNSDSPADLAVTLGADYHYTSKDYDNDFAIFTASLKAHGLQSLAATDEFVGEWACARDYGLFLVRPSARQESRIPRETVEVLLRKELNLTEYKSPEAIERRKVQVLTEQLFTPSTPEELSGDLTQAIDRLNTDERIQGDPLLRKVTTENLRILYEIRNAVEIDQKLLKSYVLSLSESVSNFLELLYLFKRVGIWQVDENRNVVCKADGAYLFEMMSALKNAGNIIKETCRNEAGQAYLNARAEFHNGQWKILVVLGRSDGNKDIGKSGANIQILESHEEIAEALQVLDELLPIAPELGPLKEVVLEVLHGMGGTYARGNMPISELISSLTDAVWNGIASVTTQGERVEEWLRSVEAAMDKRKKIFAAMVRRAVSEKEISPESREFGDIVKLESYKAYREIIDMLKQRPELWKVVRKILNLLGTLKKANRPLYRIGSEPTFENLRAIPWVAVWEFMQLFVPSLAGVGTGIEEARKQMPGVWPKPAYPNNGGHPALVYVIKPSREELSRLNPDMARRFGIPDDFIDTLFRDYNLLRYHLKAVDDDKYNGENGSKTPQIIRSLRTLRDAVRNACTLQAIHDADQWMASDDVAHKAQSDPIQSNVTAIMTLNQRSG